MLSVFSATKFPEITFKFAVTLSRRTAVAYNFTVDIRFWNHYAVRNFGDMNLWCECLFTMKETKDEGENGRNEVKGKKWCDSRFFRGAAKNHGIISIFL